MHSLVKTGSNKLLPFEGKLTWQNSLNMFNFRKEPKVIFYDLGKYF